MLLQCANGFGALAAAALWQQQAYGALLRTATSAVPRGLDSHDPLAPRAAPLPARARQVICLYMDGGPSQLDTFDWKPRLAKEHGQRIQLANVPKTQFADVGTVLQSPWEFKPRGQSGLMVSELLTCPPRTSPPPQCQVGRIRGRQRWHERASSPHAARIPGDLSA